MKIALISDIHYRSMDRHKEYRWVFERMFKNIKENIKPDIIFIGGDIYHSKTQLISPEVIDEISWFFKTAADICDVYILLGNHDGNLQNKDRQDAITPILNAIDHDNIYCLKESGIYDIKGFPKYKIHAFSPFDYGKWEDMHPMDGFVNIAAYHGTINGALADNDMSLDSSYDTSYFHGYDLVLLGDLHKHQVVKNDKRFVYPGSTIQQNYGENVKKGFLEWNITEKGKISYKFHENEVYCPFLNLDYSSEKEFLKKIPDLSVFPGGARIRVNSNVLLSQPEIKEIWKILKDRGAIEIVPNINTDISLSDEIISENLIVKKQDICDENTQFLLLKDFLKNQDLNNNEWDLIKVKNKKYLTDALAQDETIRNQTWEIDKFEFDNLFCFGKNNVLDFSKLSGVVGIFGPNRTGKSSIPAALSFGMYNATDRTPDKKSYHVINQRKGSANVTVHLSTNKGKKYIIERNVSKSDASKNKYKTTTKLSFSEIDQLNNKLIPLSGTTRQETDKNIRTHFGSIDDLFLTAYATQGNINKFINTKATDRKAYMSRYLNLDMYNTMLTNIRKDSQEERALLKKMESSSIDYEEQIKEAEDAIEEAEELIKKDMSAKESISKELEAHQAALYEIKSKKGVSPLEIAKQEKRIHDIEKHQKEIEVSIQKSKSKLETDKKDLQEIKSKLEKYPIDKLIKFIETRNSLTKLLSSIQSDYKVFTNDLQRKEKQILILNKIPCGDSFPSCPFIKDAFIARDELPELKEKVLSFKSKVEDLTNQIEKLEDLDDKKAKYDKLKEKQRFLEKDISNLEQQILREKENHKKYEQTFDKETKTLQDMKNKSKSKSLLEKEEELNSLISENKKTISKLDHSLIQSNKNISVFQSKIEHWKKEYKEYVELSESCKINELLIRSWQSKGLPSRVITTQLPAINQEIRSILQGVVNFDISIEKDPDGTENSLEIYIDYGDSKRIIELASGMEKMIASLAIRVALLNISSLTKPNFLIIDEGMDVLDDQNLEECLKIFVKFKKWFKQIFIITHVPAVKNIADSIIEISKNKKDSFVQV